MGHQAQPPAFRLDGGRKVGGDKKIGIVTAPMYSTVLGQSLAMVHIEPEYARPGVEVEIKGENVSCSGTTHPVPFYDPDKKNRTGN